MILAIGSNETTLYDQIRYQGSPESFAWVLPSGRSEGGDKFGRRLQRARSDLERPGDSTASKLSAASRLSIVE